MSRNQSFNPASEPFRHDDSLQLDDRTVSGPFTFLNPTQAVYQHVGIPEDVKEGSSDDATGQSHKANKDQTASNAAFKWTSRNNRKGRHTLVVTPVDANSPDAKYATPPLSTNWRSIASTSLKMLIYYPIWDISWWVAYIFTWGSIIWVINAFFVFLPLLAPSTTFTNEETTGGGVTAFIGATVFEVGSILLFFEAVNENRAGCFGWAVERLFDHDGEKGPVLRLSPKKEACSHHHSNKKNLVGPGLAPSPPSTSSSTSDQKSWVWFPTLHDLRTHYIHSLGFLACCFQLFGASVFWISGFTALPGILNHLSGASLNGAYWFPQVLGGSGFIVSGVLFMIETQKHWYLPAPKVLGWHIGLWNLIGGVGFTLCPCFGFDTNSWAQYQASCSTFWGSWAFLIGSVVQLYESLSKNTVELAEKKD